MTAVAVVARFALAAGAIVLAWYLFTAAQFMLGIARDAWLAGSLALLAAAGIAGALGMALMRSWGPVLIGFQTAGLLLLVQVRGHPEFMDTLLLMGIIAMLLASVTLVGHRLSRWRPI